MAIPRTRRQPVANEALIRSLFTEHGQALLAYATKLTRDRVAAEDIVQEALLRAWRHPDSLFNGKGCVRAWLFTVVKNLATDRLRARRVRPTEVAESPSAIAIEPDPANRLVERLTMLDALGRLSAEHREVLRHVYLAGRTVADTAERLGVPAGTVKSRVHYALGALRTLFQHDPAFALAA
jgi:RNA polymerase sigma-70 factor, ECF subfamily